MAQWWELSITAAAAIGGGWVGAWWTGRSNAKSLAAQLADAQHARQESFSFEREMRLLDVRRETYARFVALTDQRIDVTRELAAVEGLLSDLEQEPSPPSHARLAALEQERERLEDTFRKYTLEIIELIKTLYLIAPPDVCAALEGTTQNDPDNEEDALWRFVAAARRDLGIDPPPTS